LLLRDRAKWIPAFAGMTARSFALYGAPRTVATESGKDARKVSVTLYHDASRPSALYVPIDAASSVPAK